MIARHYEESLLREVQPFEQRLHEICGSRVFIRHPPVGDVAGEAHQVDRHAITEQIIEVAEPRLSQDTPPAPRLALSGSTLVEIRDVEDPKTMLGHATRHEK
nr:hypothetical protein [Chondromyces crocatus]